MVTKTRLDKAINGLNEIVNRNNKQNKFIFSSDKIIIANKSSQFGAMLLISLMLLLPLGLIIYYSFVDNSSSTIFWLLLLEIILANNFYKLLRGNTTLTINFSGKYIQSENMLPFLKRIFPSTKIPFSSIERADLKRRSISWRQEWLQLQVFDKDNSAIILTDFSDIYPESLMADKVKFLFDVIIWTEKESEVRQV